jgi:signal transduction histidine kinase
MTMPRSDPEHVSLHLHSALKQTLDWALRFCAASAGAIALQVPARDLDATSDLPEGLLLVAQQGLPPDCQRYRQEPWPVNRGILGRVVRTGEPVVVDDVAQDTDYVEVVAETRSQIAVPIQQTNRTVGAISLESPNLAAFDAGDLDFLSRLAKHAALAIENAHLRHQVQQMEQATWEFIDFVAHELKQPMTSMQGYARMLTLGVGGDLNERQEQFAEAIAASADRMDRLVNDLLEVARLEAGRVELQKQPVDVASLVDAVFSPLRAAIEAKNQSLDVNLPASLPAVPGDRARLQRALSNVVRNAHQYTPRGGRIQIRGWFEAGCVCIAVEDTGIGISQADQARLFKQFFRAADPVVQEVRGTGIGLVLAHKLLRVHGGNLQVESEQGQGSTFTLVLPSEGG